jgi:hypothetical protein
MGITFDHFNRGKIFGVLQEIEAATLAGFGWILLGIFADVVPFAVAIDGGTFQSEFDGGRVGPGSCTPSLLQNRTVYPKKKPFALVNEFYIGQSHEE